MFNQWDIAVALARDIAVDADAGRVDPARVARLARSVVEFQQGLLGRRVTARSDTGSASSARPR
jgi:hypothetical protein